MKYGWLFTGRDNSWSEGSRLSKTDQNLQGIIKKYGFSSQLKSYSVNYMNNREVLDLILRKSQF